MNTDAQRARNKRKRDKLRAKRRGEAANTWRFILTGEFVEVQIPMSVSKWPPASGLLAAAERRNYFLGRNQRSFSTNEIICSGCEVSSMGLDAVECFVNTCRKFSQENWSGDIYLKVLYLGTWKEESWPVVGDQVLEVEVADVVATLCSLRRALIPQLCQSPATS